ncbi:synemin isoform X1 [Dipodomys merriami]|uniref:synemin isoform X1 n=1 Tax=Dipodomys merriami TaxID=94247 RepID=UPI00385607A3
MLTWRLQTRAEKAELQELNARLYDYVCRVRELERENLQLEAALRGRRGAEGLRAEDRARCAEEARVLRLQLDELSRATAVAAGERDALWRELLELRRLDAEATADRGRLESELGAQRRELQEALGARAALEAMLGRLQAERHSLDEAHERQVRELRALSSGLTMHYRAARGPGPAAAPPRLRAVHDSYALLVAESWRETAQLYEDEVRGLEEALRRGQESRREAEAEARLCAQEADALRAEALELERLRAQLEDELLRMSEECGLQAEERQRVIDCLEEEKEALTLAMADRLRDYQELLQVKTSLSLEVATYRALLEGESNPEIIVWTEEVANMPQDFRNTSYHYTDSLLQRKNERNLLLRQKAPLASVNHSSALYSNGVRYLGSQTATPVRSAATRGVLTPGYSSSATTLQENTYEKTIKSQTSFRTVSPTLGLGRDTDAYVKTFPSRPKSEGTRDILAHSAHESLREGRDSRTGAGERARSHERSVILGKKIEVETTKEQERERPGIVQIKPERKMFDSKEKASEERNLRWEELTKLDKEARKRESQQSREKAKGKEALKEKDVKGREIPITLETSQGTRPEVSVKGLQTLRKKDAGDSQDTEAVKRETRFRLDTRHTTSSLPGDPMTETIAENIVTSILQQFTQSPDAEVSADSFPDTKVTFVGRQELPGGKKTKTEIVVESKLREDVDVSQEAGLDYLLSQNVKDVGLKGKSTEQMIGDIINLGLQGREGKAKVVNVEIVEEPMSYIGGAESPTPFQVEEADDMTPSSMGIVEEEEEEGETTDVPFSDRQPEKTKQAWKNRPLVEEVTEAGDSEGEQSYFVSTPEEHPGGLGRDKDEGSVYGQIHIEEESTIRYSWQDEIVQGTCRRKRGHVTGEKDRDVEAVDILAPPLGGGLGSAHWKEEASGEVHAEPTVIEKEIKIPHELHTSIKRVFSKEPRHELVEVIGQLEETLPERMKEELSALTKEGQGEPGSMSVDVKKVHTSGGGAVTLVAEVNLSQTVDADELDLEELSRDDAGEIEKTVEAVVRESLIKRPSRTAGSPDSEDGTEVPAAGIRFKRWATRELYSPSGEWDDTIQASRGTDRPTVQGPVSATVEVSSPRGFMQSHVVEDISQSGRHVKLGPTAVWRTERVSHGAAGAEVLEVSGDLRPAGSSVGASSSMRFFPSASGQSQLPPEVIFPGPDPEEPGLAGQSTDVDTSGRRSPYGFQQFHAEKEIHFQGSISGSANVGGNLEVEESVGTHASVSHLQLGPKEGFRGEIQFIAPLPNQVGWGTREESPGNSTPVTHVTTEEIVSQPVEFSDSGCTFQGDGSADAIPATQGHDIGRKVLLTEQRTFQRLISESPGGQRAGDAGTAVSSNWSRSSRHIQLGPAETKTSEHIVSHGSMSKTSTFGGAVASSELGRGDDSHSPLSPIALGPKETSFTFQVDLNNARASPSRTPGADASDSGSWRATDNRDDQEAGRSFQPSVGDERQARAEQGAEQAGFDKMVQLQRIVDQRSVVSDEKKVALLYLDNEEEEEESDGHWF